MKIWKGGRTPGSSGSTGRTIQGGTEGVPYSMGRPKQTGTSRPRTTLTAVAFEQLTSCLINGTWKAGDRIPSERDLCQRIGIARTSLREALKAMELMGMLDSLAGDGTFVCPRSRFLSRPLLWAFTG